MAKRNREQQAVLAAVYDAAYEFGLNAAIEAGLDEETADAVGRVFADRVFDEQLVGAKLHAALDEEIRKAVA
jgi:hypothetical protein